MFMLFSLILGISGSSGSVDPPSYRFFKFSQDCNICDDAICLPMNKARCMFYLNTADLMKEDYGYDEENLEIRALADSSMYGVVKTAMSKPEHNACVPLISQYTNCSKDNVCTGCILCNCDKNGNWNCSIKSSCRPDSPKLNVDQHVLALVIKELINNNVSTNVDSGNPNNRNKRLASTLKSTNHTENTYERLSDWWWGGLNITNDNLVMDELEGNNIQTNENTLNEKYNDTTIKMIDSTTPEPSRLPNTFETDTDYLDFDELLNSIILEPKSHRHWQHNNTYFDFMDDDSLIVNKDNNTDQLILLLNTIEKKELDTPYKSVDNDTENLLNVPVSVNNSSNKENKTDLSMSNVNNYLNLTFDETNKIEDMDPINIIKRDVLRTTTNNNSEIALTDKFNSQTVSELKENVLTPLDNIIIDKQKEINELLEIKENVLNFLKNYNYSDLGSIKTINDSTNYTNGYFSMYKLELTPKDNDNDNDDDILQNNTNILNKYLLKLKTDIHEVIRDIVGVQEFTNKGSLPEDLKSLIHAMKRYVRNGYKTNKKPHKKQGNEALERHKTHESRPSIPQSAKEHIINILKLLNRNMVSANALTPLSNKTKKIIQRIVNQYYIDGFTAIEVKVSDPNYNITNDLQKIGNKWQEMTKEVENSSVHDKIYSMKLFYLLLCKDIDIMKGALSVIDFAHSRRMNIVDGQVSENLLIKINYELNAINNNMRRIVELQNKEINQDNVHTKMTRKIQKKSFFKTLKKLT